jgi:hypothetical protein
VKCPPDSSLDDAGGCCGFFRSAGTTPAFFDLPFCGSTFFSLTPVLSFCEVFLLISLTVFSAGDFISLQFLLMFVKNLGSVKSLSGVKNQTVVESRVFERRGKSWAF